MVVVMKERATDQEVEAVIAQLIEQGMDLRFLNELRQELKA